MAHYPRRRYANTNFFPALPDSTRTELDFNIEPTDPVYSLLVGDPLLPEQLAELAASRVVHRTIDSTIPAEEDAEDDEGGGDGPPRIQNARPATLEDGLLDDAELRALYPRHLNVRSAYDEGQRRLAQTEAVDTCGERLRIVPGRRGGFEPQYTSYTFYWHLTLGEETFPALLQPS